MNQVFSKESVKEALELKLSRYFGEILSSEVGVTDRRGDAAFETVWDAKCAAYNTQLEEYFRNN